MTATRGSGTDDPPADRGKTGDGKTGGDSKGEVTRQLDPDYDAILAAVTETARGRWFLEEYARRNRTADTRALLSALDRLENTMVARQGASVAQIRAGLAELAAIVHRARADISVIPAIGDEAAGRRDPETVDFVSEVEAGKAAAAVIRNAGERVAEIVGSLRERGVSSDLCDILDSHATDIVGAMTTGTATLKGMTAMGRALRQIEGRVNAMADAFMPDGEDATAEGGVALTTHAAEPAARRFLEDVELVDMDEVPNTGEEPAVEDIPVVEEALSAREAPSAREALDVDEPADANIDATPEPTPEVAVSADIADMEDDAPPLAAAPPPQLAEPEPQDATGDVGADTSAQQIAARPSPGLPTPPADLTGLTFDQKMILFS